MAVSIRQAGNGAHPMISPGWLWSAHRPRIRSGDEGLDVAGAFGLGGVVHLFADEVGVAVVFDGAEDAEGFGEVGVAHSAEEEGEAGFRGFLVVDEEVVLLEDRKSVV